MTKQTNTIKINDRITQEQKEIKEINNSLEFIKMKGGLKENERANKNR